jgi:protein transport protein HofQ
MNRKKQYKDPLAQARWLFVCLMTLCMAVAWSTGPVLATDKERALSSVLDTVRAGRHDRYTSVVFELKGPFDFEKPIQKNDEIRFKFFNTRTDLSPYREYRISASWIRFETQAEDIGVRVGLLEPFSTFQYYTLQNPDRLVINLFWPEQHQELPVTDRDVNMLEMQSPALMDVSNDDSVPVPETRKTLPAAATVAYKEARSNASDQEQTEPLVTAPVPEVPVIKEQRLTLNFFQSDIQEVLSALAIQQNVNIVTEKDIQGDITVHLYDVTFEKALGAICQSGGFGYQKQGGVYYIYKPKLEKERLPDTLEMRIFKLEYAEIDKIQQVLEAIPNIRLIKIHEPSKTIIVEDTLENIEKVEKLIRYWDAKPKQVMIEAKILEITLTDDMSFGVNWEQMLGGDATIGTGGFSSGTLADGAGVSPVPPDGEGIFGNIITGAGGDWQFTAALDALETKTDINTLSTPKILAIHGKSAKVQVGGQQGYAVTTVSDGIATTSVEFIDTGTILEITPYIDKDNNVLLKVEPIINSARIEEGIPVVNSTVVTTWLMAKDGETVFIGGLIQNTENKSRIGIPCLGSIPTLGFLFGRTIKGSGKSELIVLITPRVVGEDNIRILEEIEKTNAAQERLQKAVDRSQ